MPAKPKIVIAQVEASGTAGQLARHRKLTDEKFSLRA
jgi:hypothetical protein